jgi:hypothetical protein
MSTTHLYQVMPDLSPEGYAALKADIEANRVKYTIQVDEEDNTLDAETEGLGCQGHVVSAIGGLSHG